MELNNALGDKIKKYRISLKITQSEFANRLGVTGASVSAYENGIRQPSFDVLVKIANILNTTTDDLLGRSKSNMKFIDVSKLTDAQIHTIEEIISVFSKYNELYQLISTHDEFNE